MVSFGLVLVLESVGTVSACVLLFRFVQPIQLSADWLPSAGIGSAGSRCQTRLGIAPMMKKCSKMALALVPIERKGKTYFNSSSVSNFFGFFGQHSQM